MATKDPVKLNEWYSSLSETAQNELIQVAVSEDTDAFAAAVEKMLRSKNYDKEQIRVFHIFVKSIQSLANARKRSTSRSISDYESKRENSRSRSHSHNSSHNHHGHNRSPNRNPNRNPNNTHTHNSSTIVTGASSIATRNGKNAVASRSIIAQKEPSKNGRQQVKTGFKTSDGQEVGARFSALRVEEIFPTRPNNTAPRSSDSQRTAIGANRPQVASRAQAPIGRVVVASQSTYNAPNSLTTSYKPHTALLFSTNTNSSKPKIKGPISGASPVSLSYQSKLSMIRDEEKRQDDLFDGRIPEPSITQNSDSDREASRTDSYSNSGKAVPRAKTQGYITLDAEESVIDTRRASPRSVNYEESTVLQFQEPELSQTISVKKIQENIIKPTEDSDSDDEMDFRRAMTEK